MESPRKNYRQVITTSYDEHAKSLQVNPSLWLKPILRFANNGMASWSQVNTLSQWQKGSGWQVELYGGVQTGDDWGAIFLPIKDLPIGDLNDIMWSYYMTQAQTFGVNVVIWVHDPDNYSKRAEVTQLGSISGLGKALGWNTHVFDNTVAQMFFYGENTTGTALSPGPANLYTWDQFQADALFKNWKIYRISFEYGWEASGTFLSAWLADVKINGHPVLLRPEPGEYTSYQHKHLAASGTVKSTGGLLHTLTINRPDTTAGAIITLYDSVDDSGTVIAIITMDKAVYVIPTTLVYDLTFLTGLYAKFSHAVTADITVSFN